MVNKLFRSILIFSLLIILLECSFDNKTGIWENEKKQKAVNTELIKLSNYQNKFQSELNPELTINFNSKVKNNNKWIMSGLNHSNLTYHLNFDGQIIKFSKYKFKKIKHNKIKENPLIIEENYFITIGEEGSILKFVDDGKLEWSRNVYG